MESVSCTYEKDRLNPVVLIGRHMEFSQNISRLAHLKHFRKGCVIDVKLALVSTGLRDRVGIY